MVIDAVIFDMDGVLVESETYWYLSRIEYARARGKQWTEADQREAMGRSTIGWAQVMKNHLDLTESVDDIIIEMKQRVIAHYEERLPTRPGALEAVQRVASKYRVGLASGSPTEIIQRVMELTRLDQVFEVMVFGDTIPNGKPAPDIYLEALRRMGATAENSVGIEDSANGVRSLHAAGMKIIATPSPDFPLPPEVLTLADAHLSSLEDLTLALLDKLNV